ncbi:MAG: DMT family transporter [Paracoccaceae bacterium]
MTNTAWVLLAALSVLWGGSFLFVGVAGEAMAPLAVVWLRVAGAALALWLVVLASGGRVPRERRAWMALAGMGLLNNAVPFTLIATAQTTIDAGLAAILNAMTPISTMLIAHLATRDDALTPARLAGAGLGLAGVAVLVGPSALGGLGGEVWAQLAVLAATLSYGVAALWSRRLKGLGLDATTTAAGQVTASTLWLAVPTLALAPPWAVAGAGVEVWASVAALALLSTALAYVLFFRVVALAGGSNVMLVTLLVPVSATLMAWVLLGERLEPRAFLGMGLIGLGLVAIDGRVLRARARSR